MGPWAGFPAGWAEPTDHGTPAELSELYRALARYAVERIRRWWS